MLHHRGLIVACRALLAVLFVLLTLFIWRHPPESWQINTNLRSLSPNFVADAGVQSAVDSLSRKVAQKIFVALSADSEDELEDAAALFLDAIEQRSSLSSSEALSNIDEFLDVIKQHRFRLLSQEQSRWLEHATQEQLRDYAQSRFYGLQGSAQVLSLRDDPFGFASNFVLAGSEAGSATDEPMLFTENNETRYAIPLALEIRGDALAMATQAEVLRSLDEIKAQVEAAYPNLKFLHSGVVFFAADAAQKSKSDIGLIGAGSTLGIVLLVLFVFRSLRALILPLSSVAFGVVLAFAALHSLYGSIHILTIAFGASLIGVAIDYALHYFYHQSSDQSARGIEDLHRALFFSLLTSVIGYAALALSGLESLRHVAIFSVLGLSGAWVMVIALGPILTKGTRRHGTLLRKTVATILSASEKLSLRNFCLVCFAAISVFIGVFATGLKTSDDPRAFFTPSKALLAEENSVSRLVSSYEPGTFIVVRAKDDEDFFNNISLIKDILGDEDFTQLFGIQRFVPGFDAQARAYQLNVDVFGENGSGIDILNSFGFSSEALNKLRTELALQENNVLRPQEIAQALGDTGMTFWLSDNEYHYSFLLIPRGLASSEFSALKDLNEDIYFINSAKLASQAIQEQRGSASYLVVCAIFLIAALILLRHRKRKPLALILLPATAIAVTILVLQLFSIPITLFHTMALFLVLGLGMDYGIFVSEITDNKSLTLEAVLLSTLTSLLAFGLLSLSAIPVVKAFGITVLIGNSVNFLGAACLAHYFSHGGQSPGENTAGNKII